MTNHLPPVYLSHIMLTDVTKGILFNGYAPLGAPDISFSQEGWNILNDTTIVNLASSYGKTPAQVSTPQCHVMYVGDYPFI